MSVLVIDDNQSVLKVTSRMLKKLGLGAFIADNGKDALQIVQDQKFKLTCAIVDITIPGTNVPEMTKKIKLSIPNIRIILASGYAYDKTDPIFNDIIFDEFLNKPFTVSELSVILKKIAVEPTLI